MKTYVWLAPEKLKFINDNPQVVSLLYDLGLLPEEISARVRGYVEEEREAKEAAIEQRDKAYREVDETKLQLSEMTEDRDAWIKTANSASNRLVEALLQVDEKRRALKQCEDENSEFMKKTVRFKAALEDEQSSRASLIDALNTELRDSLPQSEQADVGSDLRYYLRILVDQVRTQERKQTEKRINVADAVREFWNTCKAHSVADCHTCGLDG